MLLNTVSGRLSWLLLLSVCRIVSVQSTPAECSIPATKAPRGLAPFSSFTSAHDGLLDKRDRNAAQDYKSASWIWTTETTAVVTRAFRYVYHSNAGRAARFAVCQATADNTYSLYINGRLIGSSPAILNSETWRTAQRWYTTLSPQVNTFAATVGNLPPGQQAGLLMACSIVYDDGTQDTLVTDSAWRTIQQDPPAHFYSPLFNDDGWVAAVNQGRYGVGPWGTGPSASFDQNRLPPVLDFSSAGASWIWDVNLADPGAALRGFRSTYTLPPGKVAKYVTVIMAADNHHYLYVNGVPVGGNMQYDAFWDAQRFVIKLVGTRTTLDFALTVNNTGGPGGLLFAAQVVFSDGSTMSVGSNGQWKTLKSSPPRGFMMPSINTSSWVNAVVIPPNWAWSAVVPPI